MSSAALSKYGPVPGDYSPEEWESRCDLAACYRLVDHYGWSDLFGTHISLRVPGTDHFLLNPYGMLFGEITASSLVKVDQDGNMLTESEYPINPAGFTIHSAVHMASHEMNAVLHTHTRAGNAVSCMKDGLLPYHQKALTILGFVGYHDYESVALDHDDVLFRTGDDDVHRALLELREGRVEDVLIVDLADAHRSDRSREGDVGEANRGRSGDEREDVRPILLIR